MVRWAAPLAAMWLCLSAGAAAAGPTARIDGGAVEGVDQDGVRAFLGIPYAAPPVGPLRWRPPQPAPAWEGVRSATAFGPACPQPERGDGVGGGRADRQSEDCLTLNVWAPQGARSAPVMVWIHGGGHRVGASSFPVYDGRALARQGVVLVSINYRLGLLGYFAHPALTAAAGPDEPIGNYGFMDQLAALQWVQRNIAAFGGDPGRVTVFGESAGGASLIFLLASPRSRGLIHRAIVQSGGGIQNPQTLSAAEQAGVAAMQRIGLPANASAADLRAVSSADILRALGPLQGLGFGPLVDGRAITEPPWRALAAGRALDVPLIIGSNSNEASVAGPLGIRATATEFGGPRLAELRAAYGVDEPELTRQVFGDLVFGAPARWIAARASGGAPAWLYHFSYVPVVRRGAAPGAGHGSEIPFVFMSWDRLPVLRRFVRPEDEGMAELMSACWVAFAQTGRPECPGLPAWPAYDPATDQLMEFGSVPSVRTHFRRVQYDLVTARLLAAEAR